MALGWGKLRVKLTWAQRAHTVHLGSSLAGPGGQVVLSAWWKVSRPGMAMPVKGQRWERGLKLKLQSGVDPNSGLVFPLLSSTLVF